MSFLKPRFCPVATGIVFVWLLSVSAVLQAQVLNSNLPPGGNFNLTNWYLGLPVDSSGGTTGDSASISAAQLTGGYSNALYYYTGPDGAMTFWAPVTGATTPGSSFPRSELREQISPPSNEINWRGYGTHLLNATCKVLQVPDTKKVIIGQIHTKTGDARPLVKLQYNNGTIEALVKIYASDTMPNTDNKLTFQNVGLSNSVAYTIQLENGLVAVTVNGLTKSTNAFLTDPSWTTNEFYYKAGSYCQDNVGTTNDGARVAFYALARSHAPAITNQPNSITIGAGNSTNLSVQATGNGTLTYQWRLNGTNLTVNATGSTLNLNNVQSANAGAYSVRVADSIGAVTSVVAMVTVTNTSTNTPPTFTSDPISKANATVAVAYNGTLAGDATDPDVGDVLTFAKVSGPSWLNVAGNGVLSGTPGPSDVGTNNWSVRVSDSASASNQATLRIIVSAAITGPTTTNVIVDDSFADGNRTKTGALDANWWSSSATSGNSVEITTGSLGLISGTSGRGLHATFAPQTLAVGEKLEATFTFLTPATVGNNLGAAFKIALMDFNNAGLAADLLSSSTTPNPLYTNLPGYLVDFDINTGVTADTSFRKHDVNTSGRFLGTTAEWTQMGTSPDDGYSFLPNTQYSGVFSLKRTGADSLELFASLRQGATLLTSYTDTDASGIANHFGMFGVWANSGAFGSSSTAGNADNGIEFSNVKIVVISPVVAVTPPTLDIGLAGGSVVLSWATNDAAGFQLEATPSLSPASWSAAGSPILIGTRNYVTNSLTGDVKLYRLKKP